MDDDGAFGSGVRLVVTALVSAAITATLVIAIGQTLIGSPSSNPARLQPLLVHASR